MKKKKAFMKGNCCWVNYKWVFIQEDIRDKVKFLLDFFKLYNQNTTCIYKSDLATKKDFFLFKSWIWQTRYSWISQGSNWIEKLKNKYR